MCDLQYIYVTYPCTYNTHPVNCFGITTLNVLPCTQKAHHTSTVYTYIYTQQTVKHTHTIHTRMHTHAHAHTQ